LGWVLEEGADFRACECRALSNGMEDPTLHLWRPAVVHRRTPFVVNALCTRQIENLQCGATRPMAANAVCRVACLAWGGWIEEPKCRFSGQRKSTILLKPFLQKRLRDDVTAVEIT